MRRFFVTLCVTAFAVTHVMAGTGTVKGIVTDRETLQPLKAATVTLTPDVKEATGVMQQRGAFTNKDGSYTLDEVPSGNWIVKITYVGFKPASRKITVADDQTVDANFEISYDPKKLEAVVVTGVASRHPKSESEIAVSRIDAGELQESNVYGDIGQLMMGKAAGVNVQQASGNVGGGIRFTVRGGGGLNGNGDPLIFVDGARILTGEVAQTDVGGQNFSALANVNPADIENIEILKGPAGAALYGTAGSNGVILITTRKGSKSKEQLTVTAQGIWGWNENPIVFDSNVIAGAEQLNNTVFRTGPIQEYNVGLAGNSGDVGYLLSYGRRNEDGIITQNYLQRENVRGNFEFAPVSDIAVTLTASYGVSTVGRPQGDNNIFSDYSVKYLVNPNWLGTSYIFGQDSIAMAAIQNTLKSERFTSSAILRYTPHWASGLTIRGLVGYDANSFSEESYFPPGLEYAGIGLEGNRTTGVQSINRLNYDLSASYATTFSESIASTTRLGMQAFDTKNGNAVTDMQQFASPKIKAQQSAGTFLSTSDGISQNREAGVYLQEELVFSNTWFFSLGARLDHSTLLGTTIEPRLFPRASGMVRLDQFDFMPEAFNLVKVRLAYGQSGQPPVITGADPLRWTTARSGAGVGYVIGSIGNPDVQMEKIDEIEMGLEFEIDNRYGLDFTYYLGYATNSIVSFPNTPSTGLTATGVPRNVGGIDSWGFEMNAYASVIRTVDFGLDLNFILNHQDNEVTDLGGAQPIGSSYGDQYIKVGYSRSSWFGYKVIGALYDSSGNFAGVQYGDSLEYLGNAIPQWTGSFGLNFKFLQHFSIYGLLEWATGYSAMNLSRNFQVQFQNDVEYNTLSTQLSDGSLTPGSAEYKEAAERFAKIDPTYSTNFIDNADWFRIRELSLRIDATTWLQDFLLGSGLQGLNVVFSVRNVALFTDYSGVEPEANAAGGQASGTDRAVEFNTIMQPRVYNFQLNFSF